MSSTQAARVLGELVRVPGVVAIFIVTTEGFTMEKASTGTLEVDEDAVAAMSVAVFTSAGQLGGELNLGTVEILTIEYRGHIMILYALDREKILVTLADKSKAVLGRLRYEIKKQAPRIRDLL